MINWFKQLSTVAKIAIALMLLIFTIWGVTAIVGWTTDTYKDYARNKADQELIKKVEDLEAEKRINQAAIESLKQDNYKLAEERIRIDVELKAIKAAIENDGKLLASEKAKIEEAKKRYEDEKDSCAALSTVDERVICTCSKLGITCD